MSTGSEESDWGTLFVSRRCCGAANCRNFAPMLFADVTARRSNGLPIVQTESHDPGAFSGLKRQPQTAEEYLAARTAAAGCGFGAIRISKPRRKLPDEVKGSVWRHFPRQIDEGVWVIGHPSLRNYGALAYFVERPEGGVLIDCPKPSKALFEWLEAHGGVRWMFLTHKDHVQHHAEFAARFPDAQRVLGKGDVNRWQTSYTDVTTDVEHMLPSGTGPMQLDGTPIPLDELPQAELAVLPQPGHTPGSLCLLVRGRYLFTGDHMAWSAARGHLIAHRLQCWENWARQTRSVEQLAQWARAGHLSFQWVLPGHGEWVELEGNGSPEATADAVDQAVTWMREQPRGNVPLARWIPFSMCRAKPKSRFARAMNAIGGTLHEAWLIPRASRYLLPDHPASAPAVSRPTLIAGTLAASVLGLLAFALM